MTTPELTRRQGVVTSNWKKFSWRVAKVLQPWDFPSCCGPHRVWVPFFELLPPFHPFQDSSAEAPIQPLSTPSAWSALCPLLVWMQNVSIALRLSYHEWLDDFVTGASTVRVSQMTESIKRQTMKLQFVGWFTCMDQCKILNNGPDSFPSVAHLESCRWSLILM